MADVILRERKVQDEVRAFRRGFLEMKYCLPTEEAVPLAARVLKSVFPREGLIERLAECLLK
jgi:hypothetical protein